MMRFHAPGGPGRRGGGGWSHRGRRLLVIVLGLVLVVGLSPLFLSLGPARWYLRARLQRLWSGRVEVGEVRLWWTGITVGELHLSGGEGGGGIAVERISLHPRLFSLLGSRYRLGRVRVRGVVVKVGLGVRGGWLRGVGIPAVSASAPASLPSGPRRDVSADVSLEDCLLELRFTDGPGTVRVRVGSASARVESLAAPIPVKLAGRLADGDFLAEGEVLLPRGGGLRGVRGTLRFAARPGRLAEIQPILERLGLRWAVDGGGEVVLNARTAGAEWEVAGSLKRASLRIRPPEAASPVGLDIDDLLVSFKGRAEPIVFKCEARLAGGPLRVRGYLTFPTSLVARRGKGLLASLEGAVRLEAEPAVLAELEPILAALGLPVHLDGGGELEVLARSDPAKGFVVGGSFQGRGVFLGGPLLSGDRLQLPAPRLEFDLSGRGGTLRLGRFLLRSRVGDVSATGVSGGVGLERLKVVGEVRLDLSELARALPRTLHLRPGLIVDAGRLESTLVLERAADGLDLRATLQLADLRGRVDGRVVRMEEPVEVVVDGGVPLSLLGRRLRFWSSAAASGVSGSGSAVSPAPVGLLPGGLRLRVGEFRGRFGFIRVRGEGAGFSATADCDLALLTRTLTSFIDLGGTTLAGKVRADIRLGETRPGRRPFELVGSVEGLVMKGVAGGSVEEGRVRMEARGLLQRRGGRWNLSLEQARLTADRLALQVVGRLEGLVGEAPRMDGVVLTADLDLSRMRERLVRFLPRARGWGLAGHVALRTTAEGTLSACRLQQTLTAEDLVLSVPAGGGLLSLRSDDLLLACSASLRREGGGWRAEVSDGRVRSQVATGTGEADLRVRDGKLDLSRLALRVERLNLERTAAVIAPFLPTRLDLAGQLAGGATLRRVESGAQRIGLDLGVVGFSVRGGPFRRMWSPGGLELRLVGLLRGARGGERSPRLEVERLSLRSGDGGIEVRNEGPMTIGAGGTFRGRLSALGSVAVFQGLTEALAPGVSGGGGPSLAGRFSFRLDASVSRRRVGVGRVELEASDLLVLGGVSGGGARVGRLQLSAAGLAWESHPTTLTAGRVDLRSDLVGGSVEGFRLVLGDDSRPRSASGRLSLHGDLQRLNEVLGWALGLPRRGALAGEYALEADISTEKGLLRLRGRVPVDGFRYRPVGARPYLRQGRVDVAYDLIYHPRDGRLLVRRFGLRADREAVEVRGWFDRLPGRGGFDLTCQLEYDAAELAGKLAGVGFLPQGLHLVGRRRGVFTLSGEVRPVGRTLLTALQARGAVALDLLAYQGFTARDLVLPVNLEAGLLRIGPSRVHLNRGTSEVFFEVDLTGGRAVLRAPRPVELARGVEFEREVANSTLKYLCPAFAEVGRASGRMWFTCRRLLLPLSEEWRRSMVLEGTVEFRDVVLDSGSLLREVLLATGQRPVGVVGRIPPFDVTVRGGRVHYGTISVPIKGERVEMSGSTGLDGTLQLVVGVPITEGMLGREGRLSKYLSQARVPVVVSGTLERPRFDRSAFRRALEALVRQALKRMAEEGTRKLLERWLRRR